MARSTVPDPGQPLRIGRLRADAQQLFGVGVEAANAGVVVAEALRERTTWYRQLALDQDSRLFLVAFGKAAVTMAAAATEQLLQFGVRPAAGVVVVNRENFRPIRGLEVFVGGHPLPDSGSVRAAARIVSLLEQVSPKDVVLVLVSGGGSALLASPTEGIDLEAKKKTTDLLLASGASIHEVNVVRKHLSSIKGGQLAAAAQPAEVQTLILSDVVGDDLSSIASGPTVPDSSTFAEALSVLDKYALRRKIPQWVARLLERGDQALLPETRKRNDPCFRKVTNRLVGSNQLSLSAVKLRAAEMGYEVVTFSEALAGEAREVGQAMASRLAPEALAPHQKVAILAGGETTVTVTGPGRGGRNQELAMSFAMAASRLATEREEATREWVFLSAGTDGLDGPTDAAGALVDAWTVERARGKGVDAQVELTRNNSHGFLKATGDLLATGPTGTNVADLQILLVGSGRG